MESLCKIDPLPMLQGADQKESDSLKAARQRPIQVRDVYTNIAQMK